MSPPRKVGRGVDKTGRSVVGERFVQLPHFLLKCPAWQSLRPVERALLIEVAQRYNGNNNGEIGLGVREAGLALHVKAQTAGEAFKVLVATGFLKVARDSAFSVKSKEAREWALTLFPMGNERATLDFRVWRPVPGKIKTQCRLGAPTVPIGDTVGNKRTSDGAPKRHRDGQKPPSDGAPKRHTYISHGDGNAVLSADAAAPHRAVAASAVKGDAAEGQPRDDTSHRVESLAVAKPRTMASTLPRQDPVGAFLASAAKQSGQHVGDLWGVALTWHADLQAAGFTDDEAQVAIAREGGAVLKMAGGDPMRLVAARVHALADYRRHKQRRAA